MLKACGLGCGAQGFWDLLGNLEAWGFSSSAKICQLWLYKLFIGVPYAAVEFFVNRLQEKDVQLSSAIFVVQCS